MTSKSLRVRLLLAGALAILAALSASGVILHRLFAEHIENREYAELLNHQNQIAAGLAVVDGSIQLSMQPADPRFGIPNGGLYWQIDRGDGSHLRSRSLWETILVLPPDDVVDGSPHRHTISGPNQSQLLAIERVLALGPDGSTVKARLTVAVDRRDMVRATREFRNVLIQSLTVLAIGLISASLAQIYFGLRPLVRLRGALQAVHRGEKPHVDGEFSSEVRPLIDDLNTLLDRERIAKHEGRERAADLAHGFKTPLTILAAVARDLEREGRSKPASEINGQIDVMGRHVKRELGRARLSGALALVRIPVPVRPLLAKVAVALRRISADRNVTFSIDATDDLVFIGDENDLLELVGNLADNAAKWARSKVVLRAFRDRRMLTVAVEDDGHGIPEGVETDLLLRGKRLDETTDGSGIGLSIVAKIAENYGGSVSLVRRPDGGLLAIVKLADDRSK